MEKSQIREQVVSLPEKHDNDSRSATEDETSSWNPGYLKQFPLIGASSLLGAILCTIAAVVVLCYSDNKSSRQWSTAFAPNVALSLLTLIGNLCLMTAFMKGICIAWWRKAMTGSTVAELHRSWAFTVNFLDLVIGLAHLDVIGLAVILTKVAIIDGTFYQRATSTYVGQDIPRSVSMLGAAATEFPTTGFVVSEGFAAQTACNCFMIGDTYTPVINTWQTSNGFFQGYNKLFQVCDGVCYTHIDAIGFEIDCTTQENHTDIAAAPTAAYESKSGNTSAWSNLPIFNSSFYMSYADTERNYSSIVLGLQYFQSDNPYNPSGASCEGNVYNIQCKLRPAIVSYPITVTNFSNPHVTNGIALGSGINKTSYDTYLQASNQLVQPYSAGKKQAEGFEVLSYLYPEENGTLYSNTYLGGMANAMHIALSSAATITYQGDQVWSLAQQGTLSQTMMYGPPNMGSCDCSFRSEVLDVLIANINQLAFLTATGLIDDSTVTFSNQSTKTTAGFTYPVTNPVLTVNTSTALTIQGISTNSTTYFRSLSNTVEVRDVTFYRTHYLFMALGLGSSLIGILVVSAMYWRYGELGRDVTLGPIEIAGAFGAPILTTTKSPSSPTQPKSPGLPARRPAPLSPMSPTFAAFDSGPASPRNAVRFSNVDDLVAAVGNRKLMYGVVDVDEHAEEPANHLTTAGTNVPQSPLISRAPPSPGLGMVSRQRKSRVLTFSSVDDARLRPISGIHSPVNSTFRHSKHIEEGSEI